MSPHTPGQGAYEEADAFSVPPTEREALHQELTEQYRNRDWCLGEIAKADRTLQSDLGEDHKKPMRAYKAQIEERLADVMDHIAELEEKLPAKEKMN